VTRLLLLVTSPRVPAGLLSAEAWDAVRSGPVLTAGPPSAQLMPLRAAGVTVTELDSPTAPEAAELLVAAAADTGTATWLVGVPDERELAQAVADLDPTDVDVDVDVLPGSWDAPGARLLDVVATMDRLRSPGGCPWDAAQDHASLAPYLLEEAYEAFQAIEDDDTDALRDEMGDVLLQVVFHARLAEERSPGRRWTIDDVAAGLVDKLVRRHPHVFGDVVTTGSADLQARWDAIKATERGNASALSSVALAAPALALAETVQRKAARLGVPADLLTPEIAAAGSPADALLAAVTQVAQARSPEAAGALLWAVVAALRAWGIDAESALRSRSREVRGSVMAVEADVRRQGEDPATLDAAGWQRRWPKRAE
jgi:XTP/dITP diphosphohydrolase